MNYLSLKGSLVIAGFLLMSIPTSAQKPLNATEKALIEEANRDLGKAITDEAISDSERTKMVERSAKTLKEYGHPMSFPDGDIPLKTNREKEYRRVIAEVVYANDLRAVLSNSLMTEQLKIVNALHIEVAEEQIKLLIPGNAPFELSKDLVENVFSWNIAEGVNGGKRGDANELVQKFKNLATTKELGKDVEKLYVLQRELLIKLNQELKKTETLQSQLRKTYQNAANSTFTFKDFQQPEAAAAKNTNSLASGKPTDNYFKASIPSGWVVDSDKSGNWMASSNREIIAKKSPCGASNLGVKVTATVSSSSGSLASGDFDKKLRSWMSESGLYPVEASIEPIAINGFKGKLLTTTLKYNDGFGNPNAGYKSGTAHIHGFAILGEDDGSRTLKIAYSSIAGSCWDNKSAQISKTEAMAGKNEADKIVRSLSISGTKTGRPVSVAVNAPTQNSALPTKSTAYADPKNLTENKLRDELLRELTSEPATSQEIKFWTDREKDIKKNPVQPPASKEAKAVNESSAGMLLGDWDVIANGSAGKMEIRYVGSVLQGRIFFNSLRKWEPLEELAFEPSTRKYTFTRPVAKQKYEGTLNGSTIAGTFNTTSKWKATKTGAVPR